MSSEQYRWPAEWEEHKSTWIAWPHLPSDFVRKIPAMDWVYVEIINALSKSELVNVLVRDEKLLEHVESCLKISCINTHNIKFHLYNYERSWLRDSAPTFVKDQNNKNIAINWSFNGWAKYENYSADANLAKYVADLSNASTVIARIPNSTKNLVLEGGAIETDGAGTLLTSEQCLLSSTEQCRNMGMSKVDYEQAFSSYLGIKKVIWLGESCKGDDTHGHIDDIARFVSPSKVVLVYDKDPKSDNHAACAENLRRLTGQTNANNEKLEIIKLPCPKQRFYEDNWPLPSSYANFYIANSVVLVPTFNDKADQEALAILSECFPDREVIGMYAGDFIAGFGSFHCSTQQEPE